MDADTTVMLRSSLARVLTEDGRGSLADRLACRSQLLSRTFAPLSSAERPRRRKACAQAKPGKSRKSNRIYSVIVARPPADGG